MTLAQNLRRRAYEHELQARSLEERGRIDAAALQAAIAVALYEFAEAVDDAD